MHCEIDPFCNKVMNYHFPNSYQHEDIRTTDFTIWRNRIDLLTGGWPCQPVSTAGKRKGKDDIRYLWPENIRAIREIQPRIVVGENVRGLTNWKRGVLFDEVQSDLEAEGYEVLPFLLPAASVNAPHRRDRIFFVAYRSNAGAKSLRTGENEVYESGIIANSESVRRDNGTTENEQQAAGEKYTSGNKDEIRLQQSYADAECFGLWWHTQPVFKRSYSIEDWANFPTQSPVCGRNDGLPCGLADIAVPSKKYGTRTLKGKQAYGHWRKESIKALGNAVVPQVVYQIFKAIKQWQLE